MTSEKLTIYRRYDYQRGLRLEIRANWADASSPIEYRWSSRTASGVWVPVADWDATVYQVAHFGHSHRAAMRQVWQHGQNT